MTRHDAIDGTIFNSGLTILYGAGEQVNTGEPVHDKYPRQTLEHVYEV